MIVHLDTDGSGAEVRDLDDLEAVRVEVAGGGDVAATVATFGRLDDDAEHAWISVQALREAATGRAGPGWEDRFQAMLDSAASQGEVGDDGRTLRVRIDRVGG